MSRPSKPSKMTRLLFNVMEERLGGSVGLGDRTPTLDDVAEDYRKAASIQSRVAHGLIARRLDTVLEMFEKDGWTPVKVTQHYVDNYKGQTENHPDKDPEIVRCVAGGGSGLSTVAVHFCADADCVLFIEARIRGLESGEGKVKKNVGRMTSAVDSGTLTRSGVETIAIEAKVNDRKDIRKIHRLSA